MSALEDVQAARLTANSEGNNSQTAITGLFENLDTGKLKESNWYSAGDRTLVGMNTDEETIKAMVKGIDTYIEGVQSNIDQMTNYEESATEAFGPDVGRTANLFVEAMKKSCTAVISQLSRFKDDIQSVAAMYRSKGASVVTAIGSQTDAISQAAKTNTYEYSSREVSNDQSYEAR